MSHPSNALDLLARRIIRASEEDLRHWLGVVQLDHDLLGTLYLQVRAALDRCQSPDDAVAVEELALTMLLTASAWRTGNEGSAETILSGLHRAISTTLPLQISDRSQSGSDQPTIQPRSQK
jgi:hypothetical protein